MDVPEQQLKSDSAPVDDAMKLSNNTEIDSLPVSEIGKKVHFSTEGHYEEEKKDDSDIYPPITEELTDDSEVYHEANQEAQPEEKKDDAIAYPQAEQQDHQQQEKKDDSTEYPQAEQEHQRQEKEDDSNECPQAEQEHQQQEQKDASDEYPQAEQEHQQQEKKEDSDVYIEAKQEYQPAVVSQEESLPSLISEENDENENETEIYKDIIKKPDEITVEQIGDLIKSQSSSPLFRGLGGFVLCIIICMLMSGGEVDDYGMIDVPEFEPPPRVWTPLTPF